MVLGIAYAHVGTHHAHGAQGSHWAKFVLKLRKLEIGKNISVLAQSFRFKQFSKI